MENRMKEVFEKRRSYKRAFKSARNKLITKSLIKIPEGLYEKCPSCGANILKEDIVDNYFKCVSCNYHLKMTASNRIALLADSESFFERGQGYVTLNLLEHEGYEDKVNNLKKKLNQEEAFVYGKCTIGGNEVVLGVLDSYFLMGSMGTVVGEKITKAFEYATSAKLPVIIFSASGGARMQEGLFSLMQMAKTSQAVKKHSNANLLYISVLTNPTYGGVTASFAMLGDIIFAESGAMIGFAGPRVIENTIKEKLPEGFQSSEFLKEKGFVDKVLDRKDLKNILSLTLKLHTRRTR